MRELDFRLCLRPLQSEGPHPGQGLRPHPRVPTPEMAPPLLPRPNWVRAVTGSGEGHRRGLGWGPVLDQDPGRSFNLCDLGQLPPRVKVGTLALGRDPGPQGPSCLPLLAGWLAEVFEGQGPPFPRTENKTRRCYEAVRKQVSSSPWQHLTWPHPSHLASDSVVLSPVEGIAGTEAGAPRSHWGPARPLWREITAILTPGDHWSPNTWAKTYSQGSHAVLSPHCPLGPVALWEVARVRSSGAPRGQPGLWVPAGLWPLAQLRGAGAAASADLHTPAFTHHAPPPAPLNMELALLLDWPRGCPHLCLS